MDGWIFFYCTFIVFFNTYFQLDEHFEKFFDTNKGVLIKSLIFLEFVNLLSFLDLLLELELELRKEFEFVLFISKELLYIIPLRELVS